jgi:heme A synthase
MKNPCSYLKLAAAIALGGLAYYHLKNYSVPLYERVSPLKFDRYGGWSVSALDIFTPVISYTLFFGAVILLVSSLKKLKRYRDHGLLYVSLVVLIMPSVICVSIAPFISWDIMVYSMIFCLGIGTVLALVAGLMREFWEDPELS